METVPDIQSKIPASLTSVRKPRKPIKDRGFRPNRVETWEPPRPYTLENKPKQIKHDYGNSENSEMHY